MIIDRKMPPQAPKRKEPVERERRWYEPCDTCKKVRQAVKRLIGRGR